MNDDAPFLDEIKANPEDLSLRLIYADWLEERGDARSEYLRVDGELQQLLRSLAANQLASEPRIRQLRARLKKLGKTLDTDWVTVFEALRPQLFRCRACRRVLTAREAIDSDPRTYRKMKTSRYCKLCFEDAVRSQVHRRLSSFDRGSSAERDYHGGRSDDE
jgi:uncharacterized protein (TIGR02996 family)